MGWMIFIVVASCSVKIVLQKRGVKNTVKVVMPRQNSEPSRILDVTLPLSSVVSRSVRLRRTEYRTVRY
jgi:hypothetical protein